MKPRKIEALEVKSPTPPEGTLDPATAAFAPPPNAPPKGRAWGRTCSACGQALELHEEQCRQCGPAPILQGAEHADVPHHPGLPPGVTMPTPTAGRRICMGCGDSIRGDICPRCCPGVTPEMCRNVATPVRAQAPFFIRPPTA